MGHRKAQEKATQAEGYYKEKNKNMLPPDDTFQFKCEFHIFTTCIPNKAPITEIALFIIIIISTSGI